MPPVLTERVSSLRERPVSSLRLTDMQTYIKDLHRARGTAQGIQAIAAQSCDLNSVPETQRMRAENRLLQADLCLLCTCAHMHKRNKVKTKTRLTGPKFEVS